MISLLKMATSIRLVNVRNRIANVVTFTSRKSSLSACDNRIYVKWFSNKADTNSAEPNKEDEDFFGIPENFKLQQLRHANQTSSSSNSSSPQLGGHTRAAGEQSSTASAEQGHNDIAQLEASSALRRKYRKKHKPISFHTTFGTVNFDRPQGLSTEDGEFTSKAQNILARFSSESVKRNTSSVNKQDQQDSKAKRSILKHVNETESQSQFAEPDSPTNTAINSAAKSNYFDEFYFPEHSGDQDSNTLFKQTSEQDSGGSVSTSNLESYNSQAQNVLSKIKSTKESNVIGTAPPSGHSANLLEEQYFGSLLDNESKAPGQSAAGEVIDSVSMNNVKTHNEVIDSVSMNNVKTHNEVIDSVSMNNVKTHNQSLQGSKENLEQSEVQSKQSMDLSEQSMGLSKQSLDLNEVDYQYFGNTVQKDILQESPVTLNEIVKTYTEPPALNRVGKQPDSRQLKHVKQLNKVSSKAEHQSIVARPEPNLNMKESFTAGVLNEQEHGGRGMNELSKDKKLNKENSLISNEEFLTRQKGRKTIPQANTDKSETAYDVAIKIRKDLQRGRDVQEKTSVEAEHFSPTTKEEKGIESNVKLDSKGFRVLDDQVPDLDKMTSADIVRMLTSRIVFNHDDFLAIDKPYGLACVSQQHDRVSVTELLPALAKHLPRSYKASDLHLVQALDRDVTGAIMIAKNPEAAYMLRGMCRSNDMVIKRFWAITKGIPSSPAGIIDIPIGDGKVGNIHKMVLRPRLMGDEKLIGRASKAESERAITEYKILGSHLQSALVECTLLTNVKHQIRLHLASGLGTPILGDHKYSNFSKLAPQRLHREMLELLKIRQPMVRNLALHLHCRSIVLKDYKGQMIFLTTYPPSHFRDNLRSLRIPKPKM